MNTYLREQYRPLAISKTGDTYAVTYLKEHYRPLAISKTANKTRKDQKRARGATNKRNSRQRVKDKLTNIGDVKIKRLTELLTILKTTGPKLKNLKFFCGKSLAFYFTK
jgi:hypothetical protein